MIESIDDTQSNAFDITSCCYQSSYCCQTVLVVKAVFVVKTVIVIKAVVAIGAVVIISICICEVCFRSYLPIHRQYHLIENS